MDFLVRLKIAQCRELFRAHLALERPFTCVRPENIPRLLYLLVSSANWIWELLTLYVFLNCVFVQSDAYMYCMDIYMASHPYESCNKTKRNWKSGKCSNSSWPNETALPDMDLKLSGTFESFMAFIACLWHLNLWLWSTFFTFFGQFFLVSISMRTAFGMNIRCRRSQTINYDWITITTFSIFSSICQRVHWNHFSWMFPDFRCLSRCLVRRNLCPRFPSKNAIVGPNFRTAVWSGRQRPADKYNYCRWRVANHHFCTPKKSIRIYFTFESKFRLPNVETMKDVL